jgi:hypothetical protein
MVLYRVSVSRGGSTMNYKLKDKLKMVVRQLCTALRVTCFKNDQKNCSEKIKNVSLFLFLIE